MLTIKKKRKIFIYSISTYSKNFNYSISDLQQVFTKSCFLLDSIKGKKEQKTKEKCVQFSNTKKFGLTE